jgi:hypothetical protein
VRQNANAKAKGHCSITRKIAKRLYKSKNDNILLFSPTSSLVNLRLLFLPYLPKMFLICSLILLFNSSIPLKLIFAYYSYPSKDYTFNIKYFDKRLVILKEKVEDILDMNLGELLKKNKLS